METIATLPPPSGLPRDLTSRRKMVPYSVELLDSLDDTIEHYINGGDNFNGDAIEEEDEDDDAVIVAGEKNRRSSGSSVKSNGSGALAGADPNARLIRRAKRPHRDRAYSVSEGGKFGSGSGPAPLSGPARVLQKNSRKSRSGFGRGLPKKGNPNMFITIILRSIENELIFRSLVCFKMLRINGITLFERKI
jgi:hypothetical protein